MKYAVAFSVALLAVAGIVLAEVDVKTASHTMAAISTNSQTVQVRGHVEGVRLVVPATATATVTIVSSGGLTLFSKDVTAGTNYYRPRFVAQTTSGDADASSGAITNQRAALAEDVTIKVIGASTVTGTVSVGITYEK